MPVKSNPVQHALWMHKVWPALAACVPDSCMLLEAEKRCATLTGLSYACDKAFCCRAGGPPWPHIAIAVLLIVGARGHSLVCIFAIAMACILATLHAKGLR